MLEGKTTRYNLVVRNKPGELAKLTKILSEKGVTLSSLIVANIGDMASIQFSTPQEDDIPAQLWKSGFEGTAL